MKDLGAFIVFCVIIGSVGSSVVTSCVQSYATRSAIKDQYERWCTEKATTKQEVLDCSKRDFPWEVK